MDVPSDEDGLVAYITKEYKTEKNKLEYMANQNNTLLHPGAQEIQNLLGYVNKILSAQSDNLVLVNTLCDLEGDLLDSKDDIRAVENFYDTQIKLFDNAIDIRNAVINHEKDYLLDNEDIKKAIEKISFEKQKVSNLSENDIDVIGLAKNELRVCIEVFFIRNSKMIGREHYFFEDILLKFCKQQSSQNDSCPNNGIYNYFRSEERRVGKECRSRWSPYH